MNIVSFNLRCDTASDGINSFTNRRERVIQKLLAEAPDIIGFQEVTPSMNEYLRAQLSGYTLVGCGRGADYQDERNPVAYRADKYELLALDVTWLSPTPYIPGSRYKGQSSCPRIITHTMLRDISGGAPFHFLNTHLDHRSSRARVLGAGRILQKIESDLRAHPFPLLLTGDFNAYPDSEEILLLSGKLTDLTSGVGTTWHDWGRKTPPRIDYIFARGFDKRGDSVLWTDRWGDMFLSDHYAIALNVGRSARDK